MPTRSGKIYREIQKCIDCSDFYQMINKNKCSYCTIHKSPSSIKRKIMIKEAYELAIATAINTEKNACEMKLLKIISRKKNDVLLFKAFKALD